MKALDSDDNLVNLVPFMRSPRLTGTSPVINHMAHTYNPKTNSSMDTMIIQPYSVFYGIVCCILIMEGV